ncbi:MAG: GNAT family N-acetyltransferase [Alphaproteobacteria bacterium]|nr:GNAT family N-acetyltransferase [Alphaproteobacteria bacterium SS10]
MTTSTQIRPVTSADIIGLKTLIEAVALFPTEMLDDMIAGYLDGMANDFWFTACDADDRPLGFGFCEPERMTVGTWNLLAIGVMPDHQGTGIGGRMISYLEQQLRAKAGRVLLVETMGTPEFERTRQFYHRSGFTEEARIRDFYEAGGDKIVFWKQLG